jgi:hypothetical protein
MERIALPNTNEVKKTIEVINQKMTLMKLGEITIENEYPETLICLIWKNYVGEDNKNYEGDDYWKKNNEYMLE